MDAYCEAVPAGESLASLKKDVRWITEALDKPVIEAAEIQAFGLDSSKPKNPVGWKIRALKTKKPK